jgi:hypothetical protein
MAAQSRDNTVMLPFDLWRELFINDADFQLARVSYAQLSPVPFQQLIEPLDLKTFYALADAAQLLDRHRRHRTATGRMGLAPAAVQPARGIPARPNAGQP